ncbi:hypothetical protein L3V77_24140 [Vibrio sp. DW001]|uniref:hypothetical protein n=1 Tax=Vibrio sp. DW001 TaxID=2912315 RepID=UPI0023AEDDD2|nr:hypothetical protein [Vibrio sp. DW001]WED29026.1 hypothetical protein L3V77_24140 [Vibrio sp. DW001]
MSVANVIPLFPGRTPVMHEPTNPAHMPCPDLPCYSLNQDQKNRGLENLAKIREQLKNKQLQPLREEGEALRVRGKYAVETGEQVRIADQIKKLKKQAERISVRWS